jgi:hypothetical protein
MINTYTVEFYVNGYLTSRLDRLSANEAYSQVPGEALNQNVGSRWHVMLRSPALERLESLLAGESLRVCWQEPPQNNWADTEHVLIIKEPFVASTLRTQPSTIGTPIINDMYLLNDINSLINNMIINQDNQQNLINNIRNRLIIMNHNPNIIN